MSISRFATWVIVGMLVPELTVPVLAADMDQGPTVTAGRDLVKIGRLVRPENPEDLLRNVKLAFDHDLLSNKEFFEEGNLRRFCGGKEVHTYLTHENKTAYGEVSVFGHLVTPWIFREMSFDGLRCSFSWTTAIRPVEPQESRASEYDLIPESEKSRGRLELSIFTDSRLSFEKVQKIFGDDYWPSLRFPSPHERPCGPATKPHGCEEIVYRSSDPNSRAWIWMGFRADGSLGALNFTTHTYDAEKVRQVIAATEIPTTQKQLIRNLRLAMRYQLLLNPDFYSDENLGKFFDVRSPAPPAGQLTNTPPVLRVQKPVFGSSREELRSKVEYEGPFGSLSWMFQEDGGIARLMFRLNPSMQWSLDDFKQEFGALSSLGAFSQAGYTPYTEKQGTSNDPELVKKFDHYTEHLGWVDIVVDAQSKPRLFEMHQYAEER